MTTASPTRAQIWLKAMRPRTLPLALASIGMGSFLAAAHGTFNGAITLFAVLTTIFLQVLSNLANDYGDSVHGADSADRAGPSRAVQAGLITKKQMQQAMLITAVLAMLSGVVLVWLSFGLAQLPLFALFIALGAASIWAAVNYTAGNNPYGYVGLGDLFVFLFFGLLAVLGTYFLQARTLDGLLLLPAISCGAFAVAVLNINNIRDIASDEKAGKISIPVRLGGRMARVYHGVLLAVGVIAAVLWVALTYTSAWQWLFVLALPLLLLNGLHVWRRPSDKLDPLLKQMVLANVAFVLLFGIGQVI